MSCLLVELCWQAKKVFSISCWLGHNLFFALSRGTRKATLNAVAAPRAPLDEALSVINFEDIRILQNHKYKLHTGTLGLRNFLDIDEEQARLDDNYLLSDNYYFSFFLELDIYNSGL